MGDEFTPCKMLFFVFSHDYLVSFLHVCSMACSLCSLLLIQTIAIIDHRPIHDGVVKARLMWIVRWFMHVDGVHGGDACGDSSG